MKQSIVMFTENEIDKTVTAEVGFNTGQPDENSPAHKLAMYITKNFEKLLGAANDRGGKGEVGAGPERDCAESGADDRDDGPKIEIVHR